MSFWSDAAGKPQVEGGSDFPSLPAKKWFSARNATNDNGGARPTIKEIPFKNGDTGYQFNVGLIVDGSEADVSEKMNGQFCFFSAWTSPNPEGSDAENMISGRLTGFLNALYATGVGLDEKDKAKRADKRWQVTVGALQRIAEDKGLTEDQFSSPDTFIAAVAIADLQENSKRVLFKTRSRTYKKKDGGEGEEISVGAYEDAVADNIEKRSVTVFEERGTEGGTSF